jgi:hypothetical protein
MVKLIFLLSNCVLYGQLLHHQMISVQGKSTKLNSELIVSQTIGQQSVIGTSSNHTIVQQGFQQSFWPTLIAASPLANSMQVVAYPNPFVSAINFQFSNFVDEKITVLIFDIQGRLLLNKEKKIANGLLTIDLSTLPNAEYLVRLSTSNTIHHCRIIKNL